ncbi:MAG: hypothetical protein NTW08_07635 [Gammaproteobacteria bacterium]|nr:hypothetical protein [Gammaproteobacteria bacterium]
MQPKVMETQDIPVANRNFEDQDEIYTASGTIKVARDKNTGKVSYMMDGREIEEKDLPTLDVRIANGGGGQSGLVEALARRFIQNKHPELGGKPIAISWRGTNTQGSLEGLRQGMIDIAVVYERDEEMKALKGNAPYAEKVAHVWMEHLDIIGPQHNSAGISDTDSIHDAIDKIMLTPGVCWLTRNDNSATNEIERQLFLNRVNSQLKKKLGSEYKPITLEALIKEGREAVAAEEKVKGLEERKNNIEHDLNANEHSAKEKEKLSQELSKLNQALMMAKNELARATTLVDSVYRKGFYREVKALPNETVSNANRLGYYTLSENGTFYALPNEHRNQLRLFLNTFQKSPPTLLLPADALLTNRPHNKITEEFMEWMAQEGQKVIEQYRGRYSDNPDSPALYRGANQDYSQQLEGMLEEHPASHKWPAPPG